MLSQMAADALGVFHGLATNPDALTEMCTVERAASVQRVRVTCARAIMICVVCVCV